jgi:hypothetical protein
MRPSNPLHLANLDPQRTAEDVAWAVLARARRDARWLGLLVKAPNPPAGMDQKAAVNQALSQSTVLKVVRTCAEWAIAGKGKPEDAAAALRELRAVLEGVEPGRATGRSTDLTPAAGVVVAAAAARLALAEGRTVEAEDVATLASVDARTIRAAVAAGSLQPVGARRPMRFAADVVRQYLYTRGVPGFSAAPARSGSVEGPAAP